MTGEIKSKDVIQWFWIGLFAAATAILSFAFACATPFAALATFAALVMPRRDGLYLMAAVWLSNQIVGFGFLNYPYTLESYGWGLAIGIAALAAYLAARATVDGSASVALVISIVTAFASAFVAYQAALYGATFLFGGEGAFSIEIVERIAVINAAALVVLLAVHRLAVRLGLARDKVDCLQAVTATSRIGYPDSWKYLS